MKRSKCYVRKKDVNHELKAIQFIEDMNLKDTSIGDIGVLLTMNGHVTLTGKPYNKNNVQRLGKKYNLGLGCSITIKNAIETKCHDCDVHAIYMAKNVLPHINLDQNMFGIANELNKKGYKTRTGSQWVNVTAKRMLERVERLRVKI